MGCGRSTMGSDSPSRSSKQDEDWKEGSETPTKQKTLPPTTGIGSPNQPLPFNHGGALLAQAKISGSQIDFFRVLDEKIENGPDYISDLENENILQRSPLRKYLEQWNQLTNGKNRSMQNTHNSEFISLIRPTQYQKADASQRLDEDENDDSDADDLDDDIRSIPREAVKEQYMFMGSLYTLTRLRTDGSYVPRVDISPAHRANGTTQDLDIKERVASVGSSVAEADAKMIPQVMYLGKRDDVKANGTYPKSEVGVKILERADTPYHQVVTTKVRNPPRPASLVLRTVFPNPEEAS